MLGGSARTEEVVQFREAVGRYKPERAVLMVLYGVDITGHEWQVTGAVDSAKYGDVLGLLWKIGIMGVG